MTPDMAEVIGLQALTWLAGHDELCPVFMGSSGVSAEDMRAGASDPAFLASVLEFITMDDTWVVSFCDLHNLAYDQPLRARYAMPGTQQVHWT